MSVVMTMGQKPQRKANNRRNWQPCQVPSYERQGVNDRYAFRCAKEQQYSQTHRGVTKLATAPSRMKRSHQAATGLQNGHGCCNQEQHSVAMTKRR